MVREKFNQIYDRAAERKGGTQALEKLLVVPKSQQELALITDDRWLATFTLRIFQSGMTWQVVRNKWPNFEDVFFGFNIEKMLLVPDEMWERKATDPAIIRHLGKVMTIPANADMIHRAAVEYGSFAQMVADWPCEDIIGLWQYLKKKGARLGGNTGPYALRTMGKDTFIISQDVEAYLRNIGVIEGGKSSLKSLKATQKAFNDWQQESGRPMCQVSQIISFSCGDNHVF
ncbi:TPA: DNA-3-methyladenine glycosylase I [Photobacterium damselae]|uniref:3-methyladenine DNA glycosylase n=1 Tax=Photobacterium damselae TaxID=38293 RepID=A0ABD6X048_PHODM|nr:DNA-3-methyladenine glycosylase I [Photobacterium damselae]EJN6961722.1 DNA-3-methyladenine glycosylase I [Photobacterium damselae]ELV7518467.1 DNA-3-methyladenine glycosylase I [Photobacterium damselae]MCG3846678.1 DNA-3-methyladenine glycosylase I [Photobacterium damselae]NVH45769.1 DNA-3-methyladenine glycosylase I [Photobacterium damselae subsp. damselae]OBU43048.1 3-methyladenine DNA glycosylase [Photobacterium damselae]